MKSKRLFTFVTAVIMILSICTTLPVKVFVPLQASAAYENTHANTGNQRFDIVEIAKTQVGYHEGSLEGTTNGSDNYTKYNAELYKIEGSYKYMWCQSFIAWCAKQAGVPSSVIKRTAGTVDAMDFFKAQGVWHGRDYTPQSGDIIYFTSSSSNSGYHVGIVESVSGSTINTIEGNYSNKVARHSVTVGSSSIVGYGVPNYHEPDPNPPTDLSISADKTAYKVGETINFSFSYSNASEAYVLIDANGVRVEPWANVTGKTTYSCSFNEPGYYVYRLYAVNDYGTPATEWKSFTVYDSEPENLNIQSDKNCYAVNETINFEFSVDNASEAYILIDANGVRVEPWANVTGKTTYSCSFNEPGYYVYRLYAINDYGTPATEWKSFTVYDSSPTDFNISTNKSSYAVGETVTFSFTSNNATELYIPIDVNGIRKHFIDVTGKSTYTCSFDEPGNYSYCLYGKNSYGECGTKYVTFNIYDSSSMNIGDINNDGKLTVSDAVLLQKWLLAESDTMLPNWKAADLCEDDRIDVFDMIEMRKLIIDSQSAQ